LITQLVLLFSLFQLHAFRAMPFVGGKGLENSLTARAALVTENLFLRQNPKEWVVDDDQLTDWNTIGLEDPAGIEYLQGKSAAPEGIVDMGHPPPTSEAQVELIVDKPSEGTAQMDTTKHTDVASPSLIPSSPRSIGLLASSIRDAALGSGLAIGGARPVPVALTTTLGSSHALTEQTGSPSPASLTFNPKIGASQLPPHMSVTHKGHSSGANGNTSSHSVTDLFMLKSFPLARSQSGHNLLSRTGSRNCKNQATSPGNRGHRWTLTGRRKRNLDRQYTHRLVFASVRVARSGFVWILNSSNKVNDLSVSIEETRSLAAAKLAEFSSFYEVVFEVLSILQDVLDLAMDEVTTAAHKRLSSSSNAIGLVKLLNCSSLSVSASEDDEESVNVGATVENESMDMVIQFGDNSVDLTTVSTSSSSDSDDNESDHRRGSFST